MSGYKSDAKDSRAAKLKSICGYADGGVAKDPGEYFPGGVMDEMLRRKSQMDANDPQQNKGQGPTRAKPVKRN